MNIDTLLVKKLISSQFSQWSSLPLTPVAHQGWDNRTFRLGDEMSVRLPSAERYADKVAKEQYWLPRLALHLPLQIPALIAAGRPEEQYPYSWSIYRWISGETAQMRIINDLNDFARSLATFLKVLQNISTEGGPVAGKHNFYRGASLMVYDDEVKKSIAILGDAIDQEKVVTVWQRAIAEEWHNLPVWLHGDIAAGNLLVRDGQLVAVIDFGGLAVGDPACDYAIAWTFFDAESRAVFRRTLEVDDATWFRGQGWALWKALIIYAGLSGTNPAEKENAKRVIGECCSMV